MAELEAESVAYVVCTHFGLYVEVRASRYIAIWDGDTRALRASLERIANTARNLIDDIDAASVKAGKAVACWDGHSPEAQSGAAAFIAIISPGMF